MEPTTHTSPRTSAPRKHPLPPEVVESTANKCVAVYLFWNKVIKTLEDTLENALDPDGVELHVKQFDEIKLAALWEPGVGLTLHCHCEGQESEDFTPHSYFTTEETDWLVDVLARHGVTHRLYRPTPQ